VYPRINPTSAHDGLPIERGFTPNPPETVPRPTAIPSPRLIYCVLFQL